MCFIDQALKLGIDLLKKNSISDSKKNAEILLSSVLNLKRYDLFLNLKKEINKKDFKKYLFYLNQRSKNKPIEYITKQADFYNLDLYINENVLIPRVETELLVDLAIKEIKKTNYKNKILFDICTGSGAIGLSIKKTLSNLNVYLSDISSKALYVAKKNAKKNNVNVFFKKGDLLDPFKNLKADYIICNPPYISEDEYANLDPSVKDYEPKLALIAKNKGLKFYQKLEKELKNYLNSCSKVFFEIGYMQKNDILNVFSNKIWKNKKVIKDYSNNDRFFFLELDSNL
jgi:release factor glutamine methyltransferase